MSKNSKNDEISLDITDQWICWWWFNDRCRRLDSTARVAAFKCFLKRTTISGEQHCMTWPLLDTLYIPFLLYPIGAGAYTEQALELLVRWQAREVDMSSWMENLEVLIFRILLYLLLSQWLITRVDHTSPNVESELRPSTDTLCPTCLTKA